MGEVTWVVPNGGGRVYRTTDGGQTWTTVTATGLSEDVFSISLRSPTAATAVMVTSACTGFKTGCQLHSYLIDTTNGGRSWTGLLPAGGG
jgi:photosystem II stability/assembly factor-like uncharacterized protein